MSSNFDPASIGLSTGRNTQLRAPVRGSPFFYKPKRGEKFLMGPIPWKWLCAAAQESGRGLHVAIELWHLVGLTKAGQISINLSRLSELGVSKDAARRALKKLEEKNLVSVDRRSGRKARVTILLGDRTPDRGSTEAKLGAEGG